MKKIPLSILCGLAAILVTIILYFVIIGNIFAQIICFITLLGVVLAEATVTVLAYFSKGEPRKVAAAIVAGLLPVIAVLLSWIYIVNFPYGYFSYIGYYSVAFIIVLVIAAILWKFSGNRVEQNIDLQNSKANMLELRKLVKCILLKPAANDYKKELNAIEEKLHFSNDAIITESDSVIRDMLVELENNIGNDGFNTLKHIESIAHEIDRRTILTKNTI